MAALERPWADRLIAGVCAALGERLGIPPLAVRVCAVLTASASLPVYLVLWALTPSAQPEVRARRA